MKSLVSMVLLMAFICLTLAQKQAKYTPKYDNVNIDSVLGNNRLLANYLGCLLETRSCTREGHELKKLLPDAIQSGCSKCTSAQKSNSRRVITFLRSKKPDEWKKLTDKYDPKGLFKARVDAGLI